MDADLARRLEEGDLRVIGRFAAASNLTLLAEIDGARCIYKPTSGERPLWDFPTGTLGHREVATYLVAVELGWSIVPPTVWRTTGPMGPGICQQFIEAGPTVAVDLFPPSQVPASWHRVVAGESETGAQVVLAHAATSDLQAIAAFDLVVNNADRKGSHLITDQAGRSWGIDHGLTFHEEDKLRTVLWGFADSELPVELHRDLEALADRWPSLDLGPWLSEAEIRSTGERLLELVANGCYPAPAPGWPRLPWPPI